MQKNEEEDEKNEEGNVEEWIKECGRMDKGMRKNGEENVEEWRRECRRMKKKMRRMKKVLQKIG